MPWGGGDCSDFHLKYENLPTIKCKFVRFDLNIWNAAFEFYMSTHTRFFSYDWLKMKRESYGKFFHNTIKKYYKIIANERVEWLLNIWFRRVEDNFTVPSGTFVVWRGFIYQIISDYLHIFVLTTLVITTKSCEKPYKVKRAYPTLCTIKYYT